MPIPGLEWYDPGASPPPPQLAPCPPEEAGLGLGRSHRRGWVTTLSQARLTFPRGTQASHPGPAPGLPLLPSVALGPRAVSQLPGDARLPGGGGR